MSILSDAAAFREAIAQIVRDEIQSETRDCFRVRKAKVTTAPTATVMGVQLVGDETELFLPYSSVVSDALVGDVVWVGILFGSMRNAFVWENATFDNGSGPVQPSSAIAVVDEPDGNGGTIRHINGVSLQGDTVSPSVLLNGYTAHNARGEPITGVYTP